MQWSADSGLWSQEKQWEYVNGLKLIVGIYAMQAVAKGKQNVHIHLRMANTLSLSYVTRMEGTQSTTLTEVACQLWDWWLHQQMTLSAPIG